MYKKILFLRVENGELNWFENGDEDNDTVKEQNIWKMKIRINRIT